MRAFIINILVFFVSAIVYADIHTADTCSRADVLTAYTAASDGDVVEIPEGECTWTSSFAVGKSLTMQGAGIDVTILTDDAASINGIFNLGSNTAGKVRLTGMTILKGTGNGIGIRMTANKSATIEVDNIKLDGDWYPGSNNHMKIFGADEGAAFPIVIHNNEIIVDNSASEIILIIGDSNGVPSWGAPTDLETLTQVYIEDNTFTMSGAPRSSSGKPIHLGFGGRAVFRHNTVYNMYLFDIHDGSEGGRHFVVNDNALIIESGWSVDVATAIRNGTGYLYNNVITEQGTIPDSLQIKFYALEQSTSGCCTPSGGPPEFCSSQPGRGEDDALEPLYEYNNTKFSGTDMDFSVSNWVGDCEPDLDPNTYLIENRDYYNDTQWPGYVEAEYPHPSRTSEDSIPTHNLGTFSGSGSIQ